MVAVLSQMYVNDCDLVASVGSHKLIAALLLLRTLDVAGVVSSVSVPVNALVRPIWRICPSYVPAWRISPVYAVAESDVTRRILAVVVSV